MSFKYTKSLSSDFGGNLNPSQLQKIINDNDSIGKRCTNVISDASSPDDVHIIFTSYLSSEEEQILIFLISNYSIEIPLYGNEYQFVESSVESSTTSTSYINKLRLITSSLYGGNYHIGWMYKCRCSLSDKNIIRVNLDNTTILSEVQYLSKDNNNIQSSGFKNIKISSGIHIIDIDFHRKDSIGFVSISNTSLSLFKTD